MISRKKMLFLAAVLFLSNGAPVVQAESLLRGT